MDHNDGLRDVRSIVTFERLEPEAKARLKELGLDDVEQLYAWHVGNKERVWAMEHNQGMMCVLWWDPEHTVYKVTQRHT